MTEIRHIVFDLGNVLLRWEPELPYRELIADEAERRRFLAEICNGAWLIETDRGLGWREAEAELIARYPDQAGMILAFRRRWHDMVPGEVAGTEDILDALLAGGHDVTALTNFAADTYLEAEPRFPVLKKFRGVTVSARARLVKPDAAIYHHHARTFGLDPAATLFFDDTPRNVEGARAAGWHAERFIDAAQMRRDLERYGVALG